MLTNRKKVVVAGAGSALIHALVLLGVAAVVALRPPKPPSPPPEPMHVEIVKSEPTPPPSVAPTPEHKVVDTSGMKPVEHALPDAKFQGSEDTAAASKEPPTGDKPLPTQKGRIAPSYVFDTSPPPPPDAPAAPPAVDQPPTAPPPPAPSRALAKENGADPAPTQVRNDLTMLDAEPAPPRPEEDNPYDPSFRSTAPPPPVPFPHATPASAYRPMAERTASSGNITTQGEASVDAVSTPYGRYQKAVLGAIRAVWTREIEARSDTASLGTIKFHFAIDRTGHVHAPRILSNSSNEALESITLDSINRAAIPPIPPEVIESMNGAMLQLDVTFQCL